ncbi:response regulator [bacterium]|nr:MAG: response regulator [bacterium]
MTRAEIASLLRLDGEPRRVLVVEDAPGHYDAMVAWLEREGYAVTAFGEIHTLENGILAGETIDDRPASVEVATLDVAFLDFYFPKEPWNGGRLARALIAANPQIRVYGMSSVGAKNAEMVREGALGGMLKRDVASLIR